ncbi:ferric reductase-like transmembrane domain-containing protein [Accumulibacter sp.]|uniref:ferric reductase-like transmembrane domain-containing protein n=1 Tax=Accumulibacter sp. TaxID=2053492 RepID=UPI001D8B3E26|nr:ferric reductase-like transmembrane domain-containing protein [Accumulibacter sp.]MCB1967269.1 ferric reductase-like transmembrane domain-containing protein [Accumulibacter sp.]MCP5230456.1 ferric reductase-like transmembrane domain-containing protein [Accumulibacter sp.]
MNPTLTNPTARRMGAPLVALSITVGGLCWAFPDGLPPWRTAAIISGWAGTGLLVSSLLLMVREPHLARLLGGLELSYRWHHRCGMLAYLLLLCHPLALALDGWSEAPHLAWQTLDPRSQSWPLWLGWTGLLLLMFGLATTFAVHLPYRRWRNFHFVLAAGVVSGLAHVYVLLGNDRMLLALLAVAMLAIGWRLLASDLGLAARPYRVTQVERAAAGVIEASLAPCAAALAVTPGQFILAAFGDGVHYQGCGEFHPFTVSGIDRQGRLRISVKALGPCSRHLQEVEAGVLVHLEGPFGTFLHDLRPIPQLWVAGGIGITPFIAELRAQHCSQPTTLLYLYRHDADALFLEELETANREDPQFVLLTDASGPEQPDVDRLLDQVSRLGERQVHMCGPQPLLAEISRALRRRGVSTAAVHFESFRFR